jgi:hypothetical protein
MKMEQIECSETSAYKIQTPGNHPEENIQHVECYSITSKIVHLVGFTTEIYHDARSHKRQISALFIAFPYKIKLHRGSGWDMQGSVFCFSENLFAY